MAQRLKRVFGIDIETCRTYGGALRIIACIEDPEVIAKILSHFDKKGTAQETGILPEGRAPPSADITTPLVQPRLMGRARQGVSCADPRESGQ